MERLIQVLDELDDLCAAVRHRLRWWPGARPRLRHPRRPAPAR